MADCVIVGGGLVGLTTAYTLNQRGLDITVIEQRRLGGSASWAAGGILSPMYPWRYPDEVVQLASSGAHQYPALSAELASATGVDPEWFPCGLLTLDIPENKSLVAWADRTGTALEVCPKEWVNKQIPSMSFDGAAAWMKQVATIRTPRLIKALHSYLRQRGVALVESHKVTGLIRDGNRAVGVDLGGNKCLGERVVIASGAWSGLPLADLPEMPPIYPVRGQIIHLDAPEDFISTMILKENKYLIPRKSGSILVGSTTENVGFEERITPEARNELHDFALNLFPELAGRRVINHWCGLRPGSDDSIPYICVHPHVENLYFNTGHFRNGIVMAPAAAELLAKIMLGDKPAQAAAFGFHRPETNRN